MNVTFQGAQHQQQTNQPLVWILITVAIFGSLLLANYLRPELINQAQLGKLGYTALQERQALASLPPLLDQDGNAVDASLFQGKWSLVFFGFTYCPDACPTTMSVLSQVNRELGDFAPQMILVGVDPERDSPQILKEYVHAFSPDFLALTGELKDLNDFAAFLHVVFSKSEDKPGYLVEHSTHVALINPAGEFSGYFRVPHREDAMVTALRQLM